MGTVLRLCAVLLLVAALYLHDAPLRLFNGSTRVAHTSEPAPLATSTPLASIAAAAPAESCHVDLVLANGSVGADALRAWRARLPATSYVLLLGDSHLRAAWTSFGAVLYDRHWSVNLTQYHQPHLVCCGSSASRSSPACLSAEIGGTLCSRRRA